MSGCIIIRVATYVVEQLQLTIKKEKIFPSTVQTFYLCGQPTTITIVMHLTDNRFFFSVSVFILFTQKWFVEFGRHFRITMSVQTTAWVGHMANYEISDSKLLFNTKPRRVHRRCNICITTGTTIIIMLVHSHVDVWYKVGTSKTTRRDDNVVKMIRFSPQICFGIRSNSIKHHVARLLNYFQI